ncbi:l-lactate dehydrogenase-like protein [Periconia macrospinosa]|uniref:L-lactate dehydrogenase-like protein n=1 Tax=Periconia macrospinosa TaxID=97972 RepID=A0A2V1DIT8_9PLEO|nr:l-lactate dehydrogenase-like protein [Periconia macrospinosa]
MSSPPPHRLKTTIAIIGAGDVGSTIAYTLILSSISSEVIMVDPKTELLEGQVRDLGDATYGGRSGTRVRVGTSKEAGQADVIVVTAGAKQRDGESRIDLLGRNLTILKSVFDPMQPIASTAVVLMVANPVDILTYFARKLSGLPESQVLGTGTSLDSARLRGELARRAVVAASSIDAYVLGEHGEGQFIAWSSASIGTAPLHHALPKDSLTADAKRDIASHTRGAAGAIIKAKGCTNYGIGSVAASLCKYILFDSHTVRPLSFYQPDLDVCLSMPAVIGRKGIIRPIHVELDQGEKEALERCARDLRDVIEKAEKEL